MNPRFLLAASLLLIALVPMTPAASACRSDVEPLKSICEGHAPPLPCLSAACVVADVHYVVDPAEACAIMIATYDWYHWDPANDPAPQFDCYDFNN